jgi:hypothetical protein
VLGATESSSDVAQDARIGEEGQMGIEGLC